MQKVDSFIGKDLLDMLMFSMYPDAKIIYREYVQNAFDSITSAVEGKVLNKVKDGIVSIKIDPSIRCISIKDNGTGISSDHALKVLTSIADSQKDGFERAGVYGIGRLVGAGYCKTLEFRTSAKGEPVASIVTFDVDKTRRILDDDNDRSSATDVLNKIVSYNSVEEKTDEHYFEVILHNVKADYPILLSQESIIDYLKEVAPIDYEMPFKNNVMFPSLEEGGNFESLQKDLKFIKLSVNDNIDIRKRYRNVVEGTGDEIYGLQYFSLDDPIYGQLAWGWFAITKLTKAIPASDANRGIRLRKLNIQVGESNYLNEFFDEVRGNNYFYGEIHAVHRNLRPNTSRAGLTPTVEATILFKKLKDYFKELKFLYNLANKAKTATRDIAASSTKIVQEGISDKEKKDAQAALSSGHKKLESAEKAASAQSGSNSAAVTKILQQYKQEIPSTTVSPSSNSSGKQVGTSTIISSQNTGDNIETNSENGATANSGPSNTNNGAQASHVTASNDLFQPILAKYPKEQIWIIRKVFKSLSENCPKAQIELIEDLKRLVIKDLEK